MVLQLRHQSLGFAALSVALCTMAGYALAKYRFRGNNVIFLGVLVSQMIPFNLLIVSLFFIIIQLGLKETYWGAIIPLAASPIGLFFMRVYCMSVNDEMMDSARVDGANEYRIFWSIALPNLRPGLATLFILFALEYWNNLLWPLIVFLKKENFPLAVGLASMVNSYQIQYDLCWPGRCWRPCRSSSCSSSFDGSSWRARRSRGRASSEPASVPGPRRGGRRDGQCRMSDPYADIRAAAAAASHQIAEAGLVLLAFGNASAVDRARGVFAIKPSGIPCADRAPGPVPSSWPSRMVASWRVTCARPRTSPPTGGCTRRSPASAASSTPIPRTPRRGRRPGEPSPAWARPTPTTSGATSP